MGNWLHFKEFKALINLDDVRQINLIKNKLVITFKDGTELNLLSKSKKEGMKLYEDVALLLME